jgi:hypothetical protein
MSMENGWDLDIPPTDSEYCSFGCMPMDHGEEVTVTVRRVPNIEQSVLSFTRLTANGSETTSVRLTEAELAATALEIERHINGEPDTS